MECQEFFFSFGTPKLNTKLWKVKSFMLLTLQTSMLNYGMLNKEKKQTIKKQQLDFNRHIYDAELGALRNKKPLVAPKFNVGLWSAKIKNILSIPKFGTKLWNAKKRKKRVKSSYLILVAILMAKIFWLTYSFQGLSTLAFEKLQ